jgi:hypothetical protein
VAGESYTFLGWHGDWYMRIDMLLFPHPEMATTASGSMTISTLVYRTRVQHLAMNPYPMKAKSLEFSESRSGELDLPNDQTQIIQSSAALRIIGMDLVSVGVFELGVPNLMDLHLTLALLPFLLTALYRSEFTRTAFGFAVNISPMEISVQGAR